MEGDGLVLGNGHVTLVVKAMALLTRIAETLAHIADLQESSDDNPELRRRLNGAALIDANGQATLEFDTLPGSTWELLSYAGTATAAPAGRLALYFDAIDVQRVFHTRIPLDVIFSQAAEGGEEIPSESKIVAQFTGYPPGTQVTLNLQVVQRRPRAQYRPHGRGEQSPNKAPQGIPLPHVDAAGVDTTPHIPQQRGQWG